MVRRHKENPSNLPWFQHILHSVQARLQLAKCDALLLLLLLLTGEVTKQPNRSIQITKPTSAAFLMLSAWEEEGEREGGCLLSLSSQGNEGCCAWVRGWWSSESYPTICVTWAASLGVHSSALMTMPGTLFRLFSDSCQTASLSVCASLAVSMVCVRACVSFVPFVFYFHFNHNCVQLLFLLPHFFHLFSCTLSAAGKIGWLSLPSPTTFPSPFHCPLLSIRFSCFLSLFLSLFFCFCFYDFVLASVTCCLSTPALLPAHIFRRFPSRFSAWAAAAARHVCVWLCVCACSTVSSTIAHHIN